MDEIRKENKRDKDGSEKNKNGGKSHSDMLDEKVPIFFPFSMSSSFPLNISKFLKPCKSDLGVNV